MSCFCKNCNRSHPDGAGQDALQQLPVLQSMVYTAPVENAVDWDISITKRPSFKVMMTDRSRLAMCPEARARTILEMADYLRGKGLLVDVQMATGKAYGNRFYPMMWVECSSLLEPVHGKEYPLPPGAPVGKAPRFEVEGMPSESFWDGPSPDYYERFVPEPRHAWR